MAMDGEDCGEGPSPDESTHALPLLDSDDDSDSEEEVWMMDAQRMERSARESLLLLKRMSGADQVSPEVEEEVLQGLLDDPDYDLDVALFGGRHTAAQQEDSNLKASASNGALRKRQPSEPDDPNDKLAPLPDMSRATSGGSARQHRTISDKRPSAILSSQLGSFSAGTFGASQKRRSARKPSSSSTISITSSASSRSRKSWRASTEPMSMGASEHLDMLVSMAVSANLRMLQLATEAVLDTIINSMDRAPRHLRIVAHSVQRLVQRRFPGASSTGVGGMLFLRFICPALLTPEKSCGLDPDIVTPDARRNLLLLTKVLQNLANGVQFGQKERYMVHLNGFIQLHMDRVQQFLHEFANPEDPQNYSVSHIQSSSVLAAKVEQNLEHFDALVKVVSHCKTESRGRRRKVGAGGGGGGAPGSPMIGGSGGGGGGGGPKDSPRATPAVTQLRALWMQDHKASACMRCERAFSVIVRRHHCRSCGMVVCKYCSSRRSAVPKFGFMRPVRVCGPCHSGLKEARHERNGQSALGGSRKDDFSSFSLASGSAAAAAGNSSKASSNAPGDIPMVGL